MWFVMMLVVLYQQPTPQRPTLEDKDLISNDGAMGNLSKGDAGISYGGGIRIYFIGKIGMSGI